MAGAQPLNGDECLWISEEHIGKVVGLVFCYNSITFYEAF